MFDRKAHASLGALGVARKIARLPITEMKPVAARHGARIKNTIFMGALPGFGRRPEH